MSWGAAVRAWAGAASGVIEELFPRECDAELRRAAERGWRPDAASAYCRRCGATCGPGGATTAGCAFCVRASPPWHRVVRLGPYADPLDKWILAMKFGRQWRWGEHLGRELAARVEPAPAQRYVACPVPMHVLRRCRRGYNQSQVMAEAFAAARGWPMAPLLRRLRYTPPQTSVPVSQRRANVRRSFAMRRVDLRGWDVWLIDDVKTTGSTLAACARLLRQAGARHVSVAVAAVADPRGQDFAVI